MLVRTRRKYRKICTGFGPSAYCIIAVESFFPFYATVEFGDDRDPIPMPPVVEIAAAQGLHEQTGSGKHRNHRVGRIRCYDKSTTCVVVFPLGSDGNIGSDHPSWWAIAIAVRRVKHISPDPGRRGRQVLGSGHALHSDSVDSIQRRGYRGAYPPWPRIVRTYIRLPQIKKQTPRRRQTRAYPIPKQSIFYSA